MIFSNGRESTVVPFSPDPSIADAILSGRGLGCSTAREAADISLGPISDLSWSRMKARWDLHWVLPEATLVTLRDGQFFR